MRGLLMLVFLCVLAIPAVAKDRPADTLTLELPTGRVSIRLLPAQAPHHVAQIKALTRAGFYDHLAWFRVIDGFIAQTGYPKGSHGKSSLPDLPDEFAGARFTRGTVGMGHGDAPNSANSQFFICLSDRACKILNGKYTAWGQVTSGMEHVDALTKGEPPRHPEETVRAYLAADGPRPGPRPAHGFSGNQ